MAKEKRFEERENEILEKVLNGEPVEMDTSFETFKENTRVFTRDYMPHLTDKDFEKYFKSYLPELEIDYQNAKAEYERGERNIYQFMYSKPSEIAYSLDLMY